MNSRIAIKKATHRLRILYQFKRLRQWDHLYEAAESLEAWLRLHGRGEDLVGISWEEDRRLSHMRALIYAKCTRLMEYAQMAQATRGRCTYLVGYGQAPAKSAEEFKPGEVMVWNYGYGALVIDVRPVTEKTLEFELSSYPSGERRTMRLRKTTLIAVGLHSDYTRHAVGLKGEPNGPAPE